jgi:thiol-disulfide isomerase/thioredoxin
MKSTAFRLVALIGLAVLAFAAGRLLSGPRETGTPHTPAAAGHLLALRLPDTRGQPRGPADWPHALRVINFWATWCPPCRAEMPEFSRLAQEYSEKGVQFLGIAVDSAANVQDFADKNPVSYPLLIGGNDLLPLLAELGNRQGGLPFTVILDADGRVRAAKLGRLTESALKTELDTLLKERR